MIPKRSARPARIFSQILGLAKLEKTKEEHISLEFCIVSRGLAKAGRIPIHTAGAHMRSWVNRLYP